MACIFTKGASFLRMSVRCLIPPRILPLLLSRIYLGPLNHILLRLVSEYQEKVINNCKWKDVKIFLWTTIYFNPRLRFDPTPHGPTVNPASSNFDRVERKIWMQSLQSKDGPYPLTVGLTLNVRITDFESTLCKFLQQGQNAAITGKVWSQCRC